MNALEFICIYVLCVLCGMLAGYVLGLHEAGRGDS